MRNRLPAPILALTLACVLVPAAQDAHAGARRSRPVKTGQTACFSSDGAAVTCAGTGQDGELRRGEPRSYLDNGDGTVSDKRSALRWEKLSNDGSIHDKDNSYDWDEAFAKIDDLNGAAFAGFTDWRLPNESELETLVNRGTVFPAVSSAFSNGCTAGCTVLTCSCTVAVETIFWSSTSYANGVNGPKSAWLVNFFDGTAYVAPKTDANHVRAVRGGS
jgi:hypothetical protein